MEQNKKQLTIRSNTIGGDFAKQTMVIVVNSDGEEPVLVIKKLVLSSDIELYKDYKLLKIYKDKHLFINWFSLKISTLSEIARWVYN